MRHAFPAPPPPPEAMSGKAALASRLLGAMANASRLMVMCSLLDGSRSVTELVNAVRTSQSALSQHLAKLRALGLVTTVREGKSIRYSLASAEVRAVLQTLYRLYCEPEPKRKKRAA
jgi:DNA-binding transcriptional ArsR family regulator